MVYDAIIIGRGPAGISGAVYTTRANLSTLIIGRFDSVLLKADKVENYYGFEQPVSGKELLLAGKKQAERLGARIIDDEVVSIEKDVNFKVHCVNDSYEARTVLLATGSPVIKAPVKNLNKYEGRGVSYCTTCDGFFYRNKKVGVLGYTDYAVHEARELVPFTKDITIFTNGAPLKISDKYKDVLSQFRINEKQIKEPYGNDVIEGLILEDGSRDELNGLFVAYGSASSVSFALKMGIATDGKSIYVNEKMETNIPGLFAAGDCTGVFKQISVAVGQGAIAARSMIETVREIRKDG
ncbi:MAG: NAD(P)/FAD-dependent oxidoreductase [Clostridiaceae bacterium]|nr:NAD(P)/FAD-dependent oxidoreductase [Clostridiaceae bacterium]